MVPLEHCPVCGRRVFSDDMTLHHWIPKSQGGDLKNTFSICFTCHSFLHFIIPIDKIKYYDTIESLFTIDKFRDYIEWIKTKNCPNKYKIKKILYNMEKIGA